MLILLLTLISFSYFFLFYNFLILLFFFFFHFFPLMHYVFNSTTKIPIFKMRSSFVILKFFIIIVIVNAFVFCQIYNLVFLALLLVICFRIYEVLKLKFYLLQSHHNLYHHLNPILHLLDRCNLLDLHYLLHRLNHLQELMLLHYFIYKTYHLIKC
jgi:hypothetical protein